MLRTTAHSLKSSTANVGGTHGADLCRELETLLKSTPDAEAPRWQPLVTAIEKELTLVVAGLAAMGNKAAAATAA